ncbi:MAG: hypothetical protein PHU46_01500 [Rhodocyclaceae bacterium]|nr:hypothetical protein [Rhodocyclaceae bacterium]
MSANELLIWARGSGFNLALALLVVGLLLRGFEIFSLGRKTDLAPARARSPGSGWKTVFSRTLPPLGLVARSPTTYLGGYVFHVSLFLVIFFYPPHIAFLHALTGATWPALATPVVDGIAAMGLAALVALLVSRIGNPVKRFLSGFADYLAWTLAFLPMLTGYLAYHHLTPDYSLTLGLHILSAELMLALLPFTRLFHAVSLIAARWYTGENFGRKGVAT